MKPVDIYICTSLENPMWDCLEKSIDKSIDEFLWRSLKGSWKKSLWNSLSNQLGAFLRDSFKQLEKEY